jgi:hypothetical protein
MPLNGIRPGNRFDGSISVAGTQPLMGDEGRSAAERAIGMAPCYWLRRHATAISGLAKRLGLFDNRGIRSW